jgi:hypothetical protein
VRRWRVHVPCHLAPRLGGELHPVGAPEDAILIGKALGLDRLCHALRRRVQRQLGQVDPLEARAVLEARRQRRERRGEGSGWRRPAIMYTEFSVGEIRAAGENFWAFLNAFCGKLGISEC